MCVAGGKRCKYSDAITNVKKKARNKFKDEVASAREHHVVEAVREFQENNPELVMTHMPEKMGFQVNPPSRVVPQTLKELLGDRKAAVSGVAAEKRDEFYEGLFNRREQMMGSLDKDEDNALHAYTMDAFEAMNLHLRRKGYADWAKRHAYLFSSRSGETAETYLNDYVKTRIAGLDSALTKAPVLSEPEKLYRFFRVPAGVKPQDYIKKYLPAGGGFKDRGFMSTTADPEFLTAHIMDRSGGTRNKGYVVLEMLTDSGASLQPSAEPYWGHLQSLEAEVLIPRNTGMRVIDSSTRKFEFADERKDLTSKFNSWNSKFKLDCEAGAGIRLPVVRMIDENLIRKAGTKS